MITISFASLFSCMALLASTGCIAAVVVLCRQGARLRARCEATDEMLAALQRELQGMAAVSATTGSRVKRVESECSGVAERVEQVEMRATPPAFDTAIEFARRGGDVAQLVGRFGMSRGEAELTVRMHGAKRSA